MSDLGDLPLLQDVASTNVWESWGVRFRDVVILNEKNECFAIFNLTDNNLSDAKNYAALKGLMEAALQGDTSPSPCP
tara:strand:- start:358 stop:588 length:231 start_codon:yes stop_codon:yes gene_type:complete